MLNYYNQTSKIMADKVEKILDIKVNYNEAIKAIAEYQTKIDKAKEAEAKLK